MDIPITNNANTMASSRRFFHNQTPNKTSRINNEIKMGARIRSWNLVDASKSSIEAMIEVIYPKIYKPVVKDIVSEQGVCRGALKYFHALTITQTSTTNKIKAVKVMKSAGVLYNCLRQSSTGIRNCEITYSVVLKLLAVIGCHINSRLVAFPAASRLPIDQTIIHGMTLARKIPALMNRLRQVSCRRNSAT